MPCTCCKREIKIVSKGLCGACYQRWRKTGTTDYQRWGKRTQCSVKDCDKDVVSHGLCDMHRKRLERHNHIEQTRPDSWGAKHKHPLRHSWKHLLRYRGIEDVCSEWRNDFLRFVMDVGDRPSPKHKLFKADEVKPFGPDNFVWKRSFTEKVDGEDEQTYRNRYSRAFRAVNQEACAGYELKKNFGLSRDEYDLMLRRQNGVCAICGNEETTVIRGKVINLAVDHCHDTGKVRGLLCRECNQGIGCLDHDKDRLKRAVNYLETASI